MPAGITNSFSSEELIAKQYMCLAMALTPVGALGEAMALKGLIVGKHL